MYISKTKKRRPTSSTIMKEQASSEDILQRQIVTKFRTHGAFVILTDAVGPALKFIPTKEKKMGFVSWSKARGWEKGVPDLIIIWKGSVLFLELKFGKTGKLSEEQKLWRTRIIDAGYEYACWRTLAECEEWIVNKLKE
jgi:hypothetical protein